MKKVLIILAIVFVLLLGVVLVLPVFLKPALLKATKSTINKELNAKVEFADLKLSLFRNFPKATMELKEVLVTGKDEFENDTLFFCESVRSKMNWKSFFQQSGKSIEEVVFDAPLLNLIVIESGNSNWELTNSANKTLPENNQFAKVPEEDNSFELQLDNIEINNASLIYTDRESQMIQTFNGVNFNLKGKMYGTSTELQVDGNIERISIDYGGVKYISNLSLETSSKLNVDYEKMDITIIENELLLNRLPLQVTGTIQMPSDSTFLDLTLKTKDSGFENFLALVPPGYEAYLKDLKTSGSATVSGAVKGLYFGEIYPSFNLKVDVADGNIKYADLPEEVKNIRADITVTKPEGDLDLTQVHIKNAHVKIGNNPVDLTLKLNNLVSDPYFDGALVGAINFDQLKKALPLDNANVFGTIDANLFVKGNYSSIENEQYDKIKSDGIVLLDNFIYDSPTLTQKIVIPSGKLDFSPQSVNLSELNIKVGQSNFNLTGKVYNYLEYLLKDGVLRGDLQLLSPFVNLNELLRLQIKENNVAPSNNPTAEKQANSVTSETAEKLVFDVPKNIDFTFRSNIEKAVLDHLLITNITGLITAKNEKLILNGLQMDMLDGQLKLSGSYKNSPQNQPFVDLGLDILRFDIPVAFQSISGIQRMMPVASQSQGKISSSLKMNGRMTQSFTIIPASINGVGDFGTESLRILNSPIFEQLKGILRPDKLNNVEIEDFKANFNIENGNIDLKPFKTKVAGQETTVLGTLSADNLLNMRLDFKVNRDAFGADIQNILSVIPGNEKLTVLPAGVNITGPVASPEVKVDLSETKKVVANAAKGELKNSLDKLGKGLQKLFGK